MEACSRANQTSGVGSNGLGTLDCELLPDQEPADQEPTGQEPAGQQPAQCKDKRHPKPKTATGYDIARKNKAAR
eukprot:2164052-Prymnesium_polylepis.1